MRINNTTEMTKPDPRGAQTMDDAEGQRSPLSRLRSILPFGGVWSRTHLLLLYLAVSALPWACHISDPGRQRLWQVNGVLSVVHAVAFCVLVGAYTAKQNSVRHPPAPPPIVRLGAAGAVTLLAVSLTRLIRTYGTVFWLTPLAPARNDMVPLIVSALRCFWRDNRYPYVSHQVANWSLNLSYLPAHWLPFSIPYFFGMDIRVWSFAAFLAFVVVCFVSAMSCIVAAKTWQETIASVVPMLVPVALRFATVGFDHIAGNWLLIALWPLLLLRRRFFAAGVILGLCLSARLYFVALVPLLLTYFVRRWRTNRTEVIQQVVGIALPIVLIAAPFAIYSPLRFLDGVVGEPSRSGNYHLHNDPQNWFRGLGLTQIFFYLKLHWLVVPVSILTQLALWFTFARRVNTERDLIIASALSLFVFASLVPLPAFRYQVDALIMLGMTPPLEWSAPDPASSDRRRGWSVTPLLMAVALCAVGLVIGARLHVWKANLMSRDTTTAWLRRPVVLSGPMNGPGGWPVVSESYLGLPAVDTNHRKLMMTVEAAPTGGATQLRVHLNTELVSVLTFDRPGTQEFVISIPPRNLFIGVNFVRFEREDAPGTDPRRLTLSELRLD